MDNQLKSKRITKPHDEAERRKLESLGYKVVGVSKKGSYIMRLGAGVPTVDGDTADAIETTFGLKVGIMNDPIPPSIEEMVEYLLVLATTRRTMMKELKEQFGSIRRLPLTAEQRKAILEKTNKRCHLCGGEKIDGKELVIDHVLPHAADGKDEPNNYLAAHGICNRYRWHWSPEEFRFILKLGVWARKELEQQTPTGKKLFWLVSQREDSKARRRKKNELRAIAIP